MGGRLGWVGAASAALLTACAVAPPVPPVFLHGPYKDVTLAMDPGRLVFATAVDGTRRPVTELVAPGTTLSWAFAVGECGRETVGGLPADRVAPINVAAFVAARTDYIVSTGGEGGLFTCDSDAGMEAFLARYDSPRLVGIDFDIEARQTPEMVAALVERVAVAERRHPRLRFSFTLPTLAASDGSRASLNPQGQGVLGAIRRAGLAHYTINLMTMDYGPATAGNCVVDGARCDMARSAAQAAENLHELHGVPYEQIELTPMVGVNDTPGNELRVGDAEVIARYARIRHLAGLHAWSLDRDTPCPMPESAPSSTCNGVPGAGPLAYRAAFDKGLVRRQ